MKDSDLYIHPKNWGNNSPCTPEQEVSCGSIAALEYKMKFIDSKIAELECYELPEHNTAKVGKMIWDKIISLYAWYDLIEAELHNRMANDVVNRQVSLHRNAYVRSQSPPFTIHTHKDFVE